MAKRFRAKTNEHLQAQTEAFADKGTDAFSGNQRKFLKYSAELAEIKDINNLPEDLPEELRKLIENNRRQYVNFLRREEKEEIDFKKENAVRYKKVFQSVVQDLKKRIASGNGKQFSEYLGAGSNGEAYKIKVDGKEYAAKFSRNVTQANFEIKPLLHAKGIERVAQLVAYSFKDGVVIMELLPGTDVTNFTPTEALDYTDEHIIQLIEKVIELDRNGLVIDPKPSNFLYDREEGFSILDFHLKKEIEYDVVQSIMDLRIALTARQWPELDYKADDYDEKYAKQRIEKDKIYLPMMVRFLAIIKERYPKILKDWQNDYEKKDKDPNWSVSPLIDRRNIQTDHPDLAPHLKKLDEMGY